MKVDTVLEIIRKLSLILEHYQDKTVDFMLDDIYQHCCVPAEPLILEPEPDAREMSQREAEKQERSEEMERTEKPDKPGKPEKTQKPEKPSSADAALLMQDMNREERVDFLKFHKYIIREMQTIAGIWDIKTKSNIKKAEIIEAIASHKHVPGEVIPEAESPKPKKTKKGKSIENAILELPEMNQEEIMVYLEPFRKYEILEIARRLNVKVSASNTRDNIILLIAKQFGYKELNRRIFERPRRLN